MDGGSLNGGTSTKLLIRELSVRILAICCSGTTAPLIKPPTRPTPAGRSRKTRCSAGTRLVDWERKSDEMKIRSAPPGFVGLSGRKTRQDRNATVSPQSRTKTCCPNVRKQRLRRRQTQKTIRVSATCGHKRALLAPQPSRLIPTFCHFSKEISPVISFRLSLRFSFPGYQIKSLENANERTVFGFSLQGPPKLQTPTFSSHFRVSCCL